MKFTYVYNELKSARVIGLLDQGVPRRLSKVGLWSYLLCGAVQEPFSLVEGVRSAPVSLPWQIGVGECPVDPAEGQTRVTARLEEIVRTMDCPTAFLSGGIDSGALVALMRRVWPGRELRTYCVIHEDPRTDEREWARLTAERNGTKHTEFLLTDRMVKAGIAAALDCYDQPSVDGINNYFASKFVAEAGETAILSGEGGDELFAGYGQFAKPRLAYRYAGILCHFPIWMGRLLTQVAPQEKFKKLGQLFGCTYDPYFLTRRQFDPDWAGRLLNPDLKLGMTEDEIVQMYDEMQRFVGTKDVDFKGDVINRCSWMEQRHNLRSMYLRDGLQTSAPFGLDIKAPLMDDELVRLVMNMPGAWKCDPKISKVMLVKAAGDGLPVECIFKKKQGFALPFDKYFREGLKDELSAFVNDGGTGLFNPKEIARIWKLYLNGRTSWMRIWQCFVLDWWMRKNRVEF